MAIRHIVLVRFGSDVDETAKVAIFDDLRDLKEQLPGMLGFHAGSNVSSEKDVIHGNMDGFWVDFADAAARDAYLVDLRHQAIGARLVALAEGGIAGITVFDMEFQL